jgi:hypothetical protein
MLFTASFTHLDIGNHGLSNLTSVGFLDFHNLNKTLSDFHVLGGQ